MYCTKTIYTVKVKKLFTLSREFEPAFKAMSVEHFTIALPKRDIPADCDRCGKDAGIVMIIPPHAPPPLICPALEVDLTISSNCLRYEIMLNCFMRLNTWWLNNKEKKLWWDIFK
jgi:hypothetical protein